MARLSGWLGAGVVTAGVSAAVLVGAGIAGADSGTAAGADAGSAAESAGTDTTADTKPSAQDDHPDQEGNAESDKKTEEQADEQAEQKADEQVEEQAEEQADEQAQQKADEQAQQRADEQAEQKAEERAEQKSGQRTEERAQAQTERRAVKDTAAAFTAATTVVEAGPDMAVLATGVSVPETEPVGVVADTATTAPSADKRPISTTLRFQQPVPVPAQTGLPALITFVGNLIFGALTLLEQIVVGPPALPPNSTVSVQTSTLTVGGNKVQANWYFPDTDTPPERLIVLQHGFLATGPMYSYTAAALAERTGAIVVTPTFVSNFLAGTGFWLGGDALYRSFANLFVGDRQDLTASALAAGYASHYGLDAAEATLPQKFAIVGHSLGGSFAAGVSGYLAVNGAADDLVGAIMLDGVPIGPIMPTAMQQLSDYEDHTGRSVPLRQIAAPSNQWNSMSNANEWLNRERPDTYNGVILTGGVHMDSMQGGNELIQFLAFVFAGFPTKTNQAAVLQLADDWLDEWFSGADVEAPELGSTITITTPDGDAHGEVIGTPSVKSEDARLRSSAMPLASGVALPR